MNIVSLLGVCACTATFSAMDQEASPPRGAATDRGSYKMYLGGNSDEDSILGNYVRERQANGMDLVSASSSVCDSSDDSCL